MRSIGIIVIDFLLRIEEIIGTKLLSVNDELIKELRIAFVRIKIREAYQILDWSELYRDIQKQLTGLYGICMTNIHSVEENIGCRFRQDDVAWISLLIRNCIHDIKNRIPAILVHETNRHTAFIPSDEETKFYKGPNNSALPEMRDKIHNISRQGCTDDI